jgi:hypothetical protein
MPKFRVLEKSFIDNSIAEEGKIVEYDGVPGKNLEPVDAAGEKLAEKASDGVNAADLARQKVAAATGDPDAVQAAAAASAAAEAAEKAIAAGGTPTATPAPAGAGDLV